MTVVLDAMVQYTGDIHVTKYTCGCLWRWWVGQPSPLNNNWQEQCDTHKAQVRPTDSTGRVCCCLNVGEDDGATTCWQHHDCFKGECTHMDND